MIYRISEIEEVNIITTYQIISDVYKDFLVDLIINTVKNQFDLYLYHDSYCVKMYMFGGMFENQGKCEEMIVNNAEHYIKIYIEDYIENF